MRLTHGRSLGRCPPDGSGTAVCLSSLRKDIHIGSCSCTTNDNWARRKSFLVVNICILHWEAMHCKSSELRRTANWEEMPGFGTTLLLVACCLFFFLFNRWLLVGWVTLIWVPPFPCGDKENVVHESQVMDWLNGDSACSLNSLSAWCEHV